MLKSKTLWFALALAIFSIVETQIGVFQQFIGDKYFGLFTLAVSLIVAMLRLVTTQPVSEK